MLVWDLAERDNWELILSDRRTVKYLENKKSTDLKYKYTPIAPIYATTESHTLLIGAVSNSALQHWFLGARASQYLYVSPSQSGSFTSGVQVEGIKPIGLNRLTLVQFKNFGVTPYVLQLEIPYWLEDIYVEVWEYSGYIEPGYQEILDRLDSIETKTDSIENYGT
jgi:hypothetical protein